MKRNRTVDGLVVRDRRPGLGIVLLGLLAVAVCGVVLAGRYSLERRSVAIAEHIAKTGTQRRLAASAAHMDAMPQFSEAVLLQLNRQVGMINRDWGRLLTTLVPEVEEVRLLSIDADPLTGGVRVSGASDSADLANAYAAMLEERAVVGDVRLLSLERDGARVVFEVTATWAD